MRSGRAVSTALASADSVGLGAPSQPEPGTHATDVEALLAEVFTAHHTEAVAYCRRLLGGCDLVDDAIQNAFTELLRRIRAGEAAFFEASPWDAVKRNLRWAALKLIREAGVDEKWFSPLDDAHHRIDECWAAIDGHVMVGGILAGLPLHMRQVLRLRLFEDEPDAVSAAELGITLDAFRCRYKRALNAARSAARRLGIEGAAAFVALPRPSFGRRFRELAGQGSTGAARFAGTLDAGLRLLAMPAVEVVGVAAVALMVAGSVPGAHPVPVQAAIPALVSGVGGSNEATPVVAVVAPHQSAASTPAQANSPAVSLPHVAAVGNGAAGIASGGPTHETPDDSHLYTATPAPEHSNWIVALGWGQQCSCTVVFQSQDSGASWAAATGPAVDSGAADRVSLPPSYPDDPRIFISGPGQLNSPSYVTERFGGPFLPLPVPSGLISVSPTFDRGDDRLFIAGQTAIWTYEVATRVVQPVLTDQPISQVYAAAAPASGSPLLLAVGAPATGGAQAVLFACRMATSCSTVSTLPLAMATSMALSPDFTQDHTVVVSWLTGYAQSDDGGGHWRGIASPAGSQLVSTPFVRPAASGQASLWSLANIGGHTGIIHTPLSASQWQWAMSSASDPSLLGAVATGRRVIAVLAGGGIECSDDGAAWTRTCVPAGAGG